MAARQKLYIFLDPNRGPTQKLLATETHSTPTPLCEEHLGVQLVRLRLAAAFRPQAQVALLREAAHRLLGPGVVPRGRLPPKLRADLVGRHKLPVVVDEGSAHGALLDEDYRQNRARANLLQRDVCVLEAHGLGGGLFAARLGRGARLVLVVVFRLVLGGLDLLDLVVPDPDLACVDAYVSAVLGGLQKQGRGDIPSANEKPMTRSIKGFDLRAPGGTPKIWVKRDLMSCRCGSVSKAQSKDRMGREPLRQLPVKLSSSMVCTGSQGVSGGRPNAA